jgi:hypothetical protein
MVIGKLIPFVIIGVVDVALVLAVSQVVFGVPFRGSVFLLFAASLLFLASTLGRGSWICGSSLRRLRVSAPGSYCSQRPGSGSGAPDSHRRRGQYECPRGRHSGGHVDPIAWSTAIVRSHQAICISAAATPKSIVVAISSQASDGISSEPAPSWKPS